MRGRIQSRGAGQKLTAMEAIVRSYFRAFSRSVEGITNAQQLDDLDAQQVAIFLTVAGYDPDDLKGDRSRSESLVRSASNVLFGRSSIGDEVAVSPMVFVGRLTSVTPDAAPADGFRSTAQFEVVTAIKGSPGSTARIRQRSGPMGNGETAFVTGEFSQSMAGGEYLLFATPTAYHLRTRASLNQAPEGSGYMSMFLAPYAVTTGTARATIVGQNSTDFPASSLR